MESSLRNIDAKLADVSQPLIKNIYGEKMKEKQQRSLELRNSLNARVELLEKLSSKMKSFEEHSQNLRRIIRSAETALNEISQCESKSSLQQAQIDIQVSYSLLFY